MGTSYRTQPESHKADRPCELILFFVVSSCEWHAETLLQHVPVGPPDDPVEVRNILLSFGKQEFLKHFKFQWKPDLQGKDIPGYKSKMVPRVYNLLFEFARANTGRKLIEDHVTRAAFA